MAKYLIDGAILSEIADIIRTRSPFNTEPNRKITPEEMANEIDIGVADCNYDLGYNEGYADGQASSSEPSEVTDLTGTVWKLNGTVSVFDTFEYEIDFISNGESFNQFIMSGTSLKKALKYGATYETPIAVYTQLKWTNYNYRILEISGGTDATNADCIAWLYENGELLSKGSYDDGFANGQNSVLTEFADWSLSTTSSSCTVSITNTHTSLYLHLGFYVYESGYDQIEYETSVVVPPDSSYSWDSGDWADSIESAEWDISITGMRFSKNGV
jgi:hypothetical protein